METRYVQYGLLLRRWLRAIFTTKSEVVTASAGVKKPSADLVVTTTRPKRSTRLLLQIAQVVLQDLIVRAWGRRWSCAAKRACRARPVQRAQRSPIMRDPFDLSLWLADTSSELVFDLVTIRVPQGSKTPVQRAQRSPIMRDPFEL